MRRPKTSTLVVALLILGVGGIVAAQRFGGRRSGGGWRQPADIDNVDRHGVPTWEIDPHFKSDVFTFVRIRYSSGYGGRSSYSWQTDFPDSDLNFTYRLQQMTSLKVDPQFKILELTDPDLFDYPFIYMLEIGGLQFSEDEITCLRRYLLNGGFLMVDDHWGDYEYENFHHEIKRVFLDKEPVELDLDHPIFHCVYDLKEKPQIPGIDWARRHHEMGDNGTWERDPSNQGAHYRAIFDDKGRMMVIICSNTDLGDGWEREGEEEWYFHQFSEKKAYPMGINIVFYAMTH